MYENSININFIKLPLQIQAYCPFSDAEQNPLFLQLTLAQGSNVISQYFPVNFSGHMQLI